MIHDVTVKRAKEINDVMDLVVEVIVVVKNKGDYTSLLDELITAIDGVGEIGNEIKEDLAVCINTVGGRSGDIVAPFIKKEEVVEPTA